MKSYKIKKTIGCRKFKKKLVAGFENISASLYDKE